MKIIILGASGQIGSIIFTALQKTHVVIGTSRKALTPFKRFDPFEDDWSTLGMFDVLINCVGQIESSNAYSFDKIHTGLTKLIIENRRALGNPRVIQMSALGASASHAVAFLRTKGAADNYLLSFPNAVVIRPSIVCTHGTMIVRKMLMLLHITNYTCGLLLVPAGFLESKVQPVMPADLAGIVESMCASRDFPVIIQVVGPEQISFRQLLKMMLDTKRKTCRLVEIPKRVTDVFMNRRLQFLFSGFINTQQYRLLFDDNVGDPSEGEKYLGRKLLYVQGFFINEFLHAVH